MLRKVDSSRRPIISSLLVVVFLIITSCGQEPSDGAILPADLRCEYLRDPAVVDVVSPRLGWVNTERDPEARGLAQSAYQIRVASSLEGLGDADLWNSGKVIGDQSIRVIYDGKALASRQECWWQVRVWDQSDNVSKWSEPAFWRMGLLEPGDWQASWIGAPWEGEQPIARPDRYPNQRPEDFGPPAPYLRKVIDLDKEIEQAVMFVTGLGYFELHINGQKVGDDVLVPNQTNYGKRPKLPEYYINVDDNFRRYKVMYLAYDVKEYLQQGENALGAILGNGFYNPAKFWAEGYGTPRFLGQLHITYTDGTEEVVTSDQSWKVAQSPILMNMVYYGETYDARREHDGWSQVDFDDSAWQPAAVKRAPEGELVAHTAHPDKVTKTLRPKTITRLENGNHFVDFGEEISGWVRLSNIEGQEGQEIDIMFNGNLYSGDNKYICSGQGQESYAPRFNWFVFSGVEISNWPGELSPENITAEAVNTYIEATAHFETSNPLFNDINTIWRRSQEDNMHGGIASDCPHRERSGYTGDGQVACATVMHNYDARNFYYKWIQDMNEAQDVTTGYVPNGAPWQPGCGGGVAWGAAICEMPWEFYVYYGAKDMLRDNYEAMKGYVGYLETWRRSDGIIHAQRRNGSGEVLKWFNLGEWVSPGDPILDEMVHTFYFWRCATITAETARVLGHPEESGHYQTLAKNAFEAFHNTFYDAGIGSYGNGGGDILALRMGVPEERKDRVIEAVRDNIAQNNGHLDTGIFGTRFFFEVLAENGMNELAYAAMDKREEPSFGRWLELGSTTTREHWDESGSYNHPMFGGGFVWMYRQLAGMQADPQQPGYRHLVFKPQPVDQMDYMVYDNQTAYGKAGIEWRQTEGNFQMTVKVPVGCEATVYVPGEGAQLVDELRDGLVWMEADQTFRVRSGTYSFASRL